MFDFQVWKNVKSDDLTKRLSMYGVDNELVEAMERIEGLDEHYIVLREYLIELRESLPPVTVRDLEVERLISDVDHFAVVCEANDSSFDERLM